jgi:hypothetical protein
MDGDSEKIRNKSNGQDCDMVNDGGAVLQSDGIRHRSILVDTSNWKFVESELRFVLYCSIVLWAIHFISTII